uniref:Uncharacterized protein n=1 Tax=Chelonoidis abingdonii TaxID=106734 RepID=A0A8C0HDK0_CHEAB
MAGAERRPGRVSLCAAGRSRCEASRRPEPARRGRASAAGAAAAVPGEQRLKGPEELPGPGLLRSVYWIFVRGYLLHTHQLQVRAGPGRAGPGTGQAGAGCAASV